MKTSLVMTIMGQDRPGLVELLAGAIAEHGGNWLESRMSRLGGQFAGILRVDLASENESALTRSLQGLRDHGLTVILHSELLSAAAAPLGSLYRIEMYGHDRPGIVRQLSHALASRGINVEELSTDCQSAAMTGESIFRAVAKVGVPAEADFATVRAALAKIVDDLGLDLSVDRIP